MVSICGPFAFKFTIESTQTLASVEVLSRSPVVANALFPKKRQKANQLKKL